MASCFWHLLSLESRGHVPVRGDRFRRLKVALVKFGGLRV